VPISGRVLLFGGGVSQGSNRIVRVLPGRPRLLGTLPQPLSDLVAVPIGNLAYVMGGWNGSETSRAIYSVGANGSLTKVGGFPVGVRYPAVGTLGGTLYVIGGLRRGELTDTILSWRPGQRRWYAAGRLPMAVSDLSAVPFDRGILALGGRGPAGTVASAVVLRPAF
jgi:Kelch motif